MTNYIDKSNLISKGLCMMGSFGKIATSIIKQGVISPTEKARWNHEAISNYMDAKGIENHILVVLHLHVQAQRQLFEQIRKQNGKTLAIQYKTREHRVDDTFNIPKSM